MAPRFSLSHRIIGYDLARALAVLGMVVVNTTSILEVGAFSPAWLELAVDFLYGRAAVVFVMLAGVSVSLVARRHTTPEDLRTLRRCLLKRSLLLLIAGIALCTLWPADILHFYAVFIGAGAWTMTWHQRRLRRWTAAVLLISLPVCAALTAAYDMSDTFFVNDGAPGAIGLLPDYLTSPYYSVFPWVGFFLAGMLLGRREPAGKVFWRRAGLFGLSGCLVVELFSGAATAWARHCGWELEGLWWGAFLRSEAFPASPLFILSSACSGLALIALCRSMPLRIRPGLSIVANSLAACGRLSLTLYVAHIVWVILFKKWFAGPNTDFDSNKMLLCAATFGLFGILFAGAWLRRFQRGPLETLFHWFTHGRRRALNRIHPNVATSG